MTGDKKDRKGNRTVDLYLIDHAINQTFIFTDAEELEEHLNSEYFDYSDDLAECVREVMFEVRSERNVTAGVNGAASFLNISVEWGKEEDVA